MAGEAIKRRIKQFTQKYGESFLINGMIDAKGIFQVMTTGQIHSLYIDSEASSVTRPAHYFIVDGDTLVASGDLISRDGRSMVVRKVFNYRIGDVVVYKLASAD